MVDDLFDDTFEDEVFTGQEDYDPVLGRVKVRIGADWISKPAKVRIGSSWVRKPLKRWTGHDWVLSGQNWPARIRLRVPPGKVAVDMPGFKVRIDLSLLPSAFWRAVRPDGGNVRAFQSDGTTPIPVDVTYIDKARRIGRAYVKLDLLSAANNDFWVCAMDPALLAEPASAANGRNAVWTGYDVVWVYPSTENRTGNAYAQSRNVVRRSDWVRVDYYTLPGSPHQGVAADELGTLISVDDAGLRRATVASPLTVLASNLTFLSDFVALSGDTLVNHCSNGAIVGDELWVPLNEYPNTGGAFNEYLVVYDRDALTYKRHYDVSAVGRHVSAIAYDPAVNELIATDYLNGSSLMRFNMSGAYLGVIPLPTTITQPQGITLVDGHFLISANTTPDVYAVARDGSLVEVEFERPEAGVPEGLSYTSGRLYYLDGDGDLVVYEKLASFADFGRVHFAADGGNAAFSTTFTVCGTFRWLSDDMQEGILSVDDPATTASSSYAAIAYDEGPDQLGAWNSVDGWLYADPPIRPERNETIRVAFGQNGAAGRKIRAFRSGTIHANSAGSSSPRPSGSGSMELMQGSYQRASSTDRAQGYFQTVWLSGSYVSDAWIDADFANEMSTDFVQLV